MCLAGGQSEQGGGLWTLVGQSVWTLVMLGIAAASPEEFLSGAWPAPSIRDTGVIHLTSTHGSFWVPDSVLRALQMRGH